MKFLPHANTMEKNVAPINAHFKGPFTMKQPSMKRKSTNAPTYTGPEVMGWSPKYWVSWLYSPLYMGFAFP